jgi:hypothetical protein
LEIEIRINEKKEIYAPRETITGMVEFNAPTAPDYGELKLIWFTKGKGTQDVGEVEKRAFTDLAASAGREFSFSLPRGPYSFSGKHISLIWAIELILYPSESSDRFEFLVSPTGQEILLPLHTETSQGATNQGHW